MAGKSKLSRLEHAPAGGNPSRYAKIEHDPEKLQDVLVESFNDSWQGLPPSRLMLDIDSTVHDPKRAGATTMEWTPPPGGIAMCQRWH